MCIFLLCFCDTPKRLITEVGFVAGSFINDIYTRLRRFVLLASFILVDTGQAFVTDWAERRTASDVQSSGRRYVRQTVLVFEACLAIVLGLLIQWLSGGLAAVQQCFNFNQFLEFAPSCLFFSVGLSLKMRAVAYHNAGTIKIFGQLRMPMTAILSTICLARHYDFVQWQAIGIITVSCFAYMHMKEQDKLDGKLTLTCGHGLLLCWVLLNSAGGTLAEWVYKRGELDFFAKFVAEDFGYLVINSFILILMAFCDPNENFCDRERRPGGFFDAWDRRTVALVFMLLLDATVGNLLLHEFSALTKCITKGFCVAMVYLMSLTYRDARHSAKSALSWFAILVIQSSFLYSTLPGD